MLLILPKLPHQLRSLSQSFARSLTPASASQPSVTFTSTGSAVNIIGGGGPFTSNGALLGGGALVPVHPPADKTAGLTFHSSAPASAGSGGPSSGSGRAGSGAGAGSYGGYTGHARALIQSAQSAVSTDPAALHDDDDAELKAALTLHRLHAASTAPQPRERLVVKRIVPDGEDFKIVRLPEVQRRLKLAFASAAKEPQQPPSPTDRSVEVGAAAAYATTDVQRQGRPRRSSATPAPLLLLASSSLQVTGASPTLLGSLAFSHSIRRHSTSAAERERPSLDSGLHYDGKNVGLDWSQWEEVGEALDSEVASSDGATAPTASKNPFSSAPPPRDWLEAHEKAAGITSIAPAVDSFPDRATLVHSPPSAPPTSIHSPSSPSPNPPVSVEDNPADVERRAVIESALERRDIGALVEIVREYSALPPTENTFTGEGTLPQQTAKTFNLALRALATVRPKGAPLADVLVAYGAMLERDVAPTIETYSLVIRALCERELEIREALEYDKELKREIPLASPSSVTQEYRTAPNLLPPSRIHSFSAEPALDALAAETNLDDALALFFAASSFPTVSTTLFPVEVYNALLSACASSGRTKDALGVYVHLEQRIANPAGRAAGLKLGFETFRSLIEGYGRKKSASGAQEVFDEFRRAEADGRIGIREGRTRFVEDDRIAVWNALIRARFRAGDPAGAVELVEGLTASKDSVVVSSDLLPSPEIQSSTLTAVITGFLSIDDVDSAMQWFLRVAPDLSDSASTGLPVLESLVYVSLLSVASRRRDAAMYDLVFDRFTSRPPPGYLFRPVELAEAIHLHLEEAEKASTPSDGKNFHLDRIARFVQRCDRNQRSTYLYPPTISGPLLRLVIQQGRLADVTDVYGRTLRSGQENRSDPLAAVKFHAYFIESLTHWVTTPGSNPLELTILQRLQLIGDVVRTAKAVDIPTDLSVSELAERIFHLYTQAKIELEGDLRALELDSALVALVADSAALSDLKLLENPEMTPMATSTLTLLHDMADLQQAASISFDVDWTLAGTTLIALVGTEAAENLLPRIADGVLERCLERSGLQKLSPESSAQLDPSAPAFIPTQQVDDVSGTYPDSASSFAENQTEASAVTSITTLDSTEDEDVQGGVISEYEESVSAHFSSLIVDQQLSQLVDLHSETLKRSRGLDSKSVSALHSYKVLEDGMKNGYTATVPVLMRLVSALGRLKEMDKAIEVLELAHNVHYNVAPDDLPTWYRIESHAIIAFAHCGDMERANFHRMNIINAGGVPSADAYAALVNGAKDTTDDAAIARHLFQEALSLGCRPHLFFYNTVISALSKARKAEEAITLFYDMQNKGVRPTTVSYGAVINACCRVGNAELATRLFEEMTQQDNFKARVPPYNSMMQYFTTTQPDRTRALYYYDELVKAGVVPSEHTYNLLMLAYGTIEPVNFSAMYRVFDILRRSDGSKSQPRVQGLHWATLINCYGAVGKDLEKALQVFDSIAVNYPYVEEGEIYLPDAVCWEALFNVLHTHKRFDLIDSYLEQFKRGPVETTTYIQNVLIRAAAAEGNIEKARKLFEQMIDPKMGLAAPHDSTSPDSTPGVVYHQPSSYEALVRAELGAGEHQRAVELCNRMEARMYPLSVTARIRSILGEGDPISSTPPSDSSPFETTTP